MKKLFYVMAGMLFLAFAPTMAYANHENECRLIVQAKAEVAQWDKASVWEYLKEGNKFDALMAWITARVAVPPVVDGLSVTYVTDENTGAKLVLLAISQNGQCVEMSTVQSMTRNEFDNIVGKAI